MQDNKKIIGGEFEIDLEQKGSFVAQPDTYYYASGRSALYHIICSRNIKRVWLPDYLCISVVEAVKKADAEYLFYDLNDNLDPKIDAIHPENSDEAILLINYFGLKNLAPIEKKLSELFPNTTIIEDDVQAYFDFTNSDNQYINYRFTSLRKTFAVSDGGLVYTKHQMLIATKKNTFCKYKLQAADLKFHRTANTNDTQYLSLFEKGEVMIDDDYESEMSPDSKALFAACNIESIQNRRKDNAQYLLQGLKHLNINTILPVTEDKTPLFIPIWLNDRNKLRKAMFENNIFCPVHWPLDGMPIKKGAELAEHELSLIIDQRYSTKDMERILDVLERNI